MKSALVNLHSRQLFEHSFELRKSTKNPYMVEAPVIIFKAPNGEEIQVKSFWDGGKNWKVRYAPGLEGLWTWEIERGWDEIINSNGGRFVVKPYRGTNSFYRHGFLRVGKSGRHIVHEDETPFFWTGDTAWSAAAKANLAEWEEYVHYRKEQGFNIIQINSLPQHDGSDSPDRIPFRQSQTGVWMLDELRPDYFQRLDQMVLASLQKGVFTALVVLWCVNVPGTHPGWEPIDQVLFDEFSAERYGEYLAARYGAFGPVWLVSGDTDYAPGEVEKIYDAAAESIKATIPGVSLLTAHLDGDQMVTDELNRKEWLDFHMFQSGHRERSWETAESYAEYHRDLKPVRPIVNGEICYEDIGHLFGEGRVSSEEIRRVAWTGLLSGAIGGITYGAHGIWSWHREGDFFKESKMWQFPRVWNIALRFPGADDVIFLKKILESIPWWNLEGRPELVHKTNADGIIYSAATAYEEIIVIYTKDIERFSFESDFEYGHFCRRFDLETHNESQKLLSLTEGTISLECDSSVHEAVYIFS